jgi:glycosyltransferase involved in cell wall biosynthesis
MSIVQEKQVEPSLTDSKDRYLFTVFTATYNRRYTLHRVYDSLKSQTYRDFEWLIIDDGSTENIWELVEQWQKENLFPIRYFYKENGGKHTAFNRGVKEAKGQLFLNLDSDDGCIPEALERFKYHWDGIPAEQKEQFSAVTCLCQDQHGKLVGKGFPFDVTDSNSLEIYYRYKVTGEKWGFHRTEVLREFPFPEDIKKTYIPETLVWNKIARKYKTRYVNEALRTFWIEEISQGHGGNPKRNALGRRLAHLAALNEESDWFGVSPWLFLRSAINYSRNCFHLKISILEQFQAIETNLGRILWAIALPAGYLVYRLGMMGILKG